MVGNCFGPNSRINYGVEATCGNLYSICTPYDDWPAMFQDLSRGVFEGVGTSFRLTEAPVDADGDGVLTEADLEVRIDGTAEIAWRYDSDAIAIRFAPPFRPGSGSSVEVDYRVLCP